MVLLVRTIDDDNVTHASASTTQNATLCGHPAGRTRLDMRVQTNYDPVSGTSFQERFPQPVNRAADVTCPQCAAALAPEKIRPLAVEPPAPAKKEEPPSTASTSPRKRRPHLPPRRA